MNIIDDSLPDAALMNNLQIKRVMEMVLRNCFVKTPEDQKETWGFQCPEIIFT